MYYIFIIIYADTFRIKNLNETLQSIYFAPIITPKHKYLDMQKQITCIQTNLLVRICWFFFFYITQSILSYLKKYLSIYVHWKTHYDQIQQILIKLYFYSPYSI